MRTEWTSRCTCELLPQNDSSDLGYNVNSSYRVWQEIIISRNSKSNLRWNETIQEMEAAGANMVVSIQLLSTPFFRREGKKSKSKKNQGLGRI
jgi:hypothetical protein